jgi:hypothetical protein
MPSYRSRNQMAQQMEALLRHYREDERWGGIAANDILEMALDRFWRQHFAPTSEAPDAVLEGARRHLKMALAVVEGELERRAEMEARRD